MRKVWPWILGIIVGVIIVALLLGLRASQQAYRVARGEVNARVAAAQDRIDMGVEMATTAVDLALAMAGDLPSQQAYADLIKQDIEEIGKRLSEAAELKGEQAIAKLDESIAQFDQTLQDLEQASNEADTPAVKATLDRIYGVLEATREQLAQALINAYR